ncbi:hypothetical protein L1987_30147 [Smallanthus sonchifolius]|uniref:Uncharacterized protein n=1 Tax=Smallanthus sonchifolius TaxID=185202 RepID=A0ACB9I3T0_9ASTR|nr:hypothetical protein L1987_30147 [Smallanthus sonchifolius]
MDRRVEYKHNQVALLDPNMSEAVNFQGIINFLNRSLHQDTDVEPHVLRATVNNTEVAISVETIRTTLALGGAIDDPTSYPGTLIMGCFQRMGYRGRPNDTQARKGGLVREWRYFMHVIIQCLSPRKAGTDGLKSALQAAMVALTLNKRFNFALYIYRELVMQINPLAGQGFLMYPRIFTDCTKVKQQNVALILVPTPLFGHLINPDYVEPPNDNWFHPEELVQGQVHNQVQQPPEPPQVQAQVQLQQQQAPIQQQVPIPQEHVHIPVNEPVQDDVAQDNEQDLGMNMDDFDNEAVNSPIHEAEGNVVDTSSGDTILPDSEATESDSSRDFSSDHYEILASLPLANAGKLIKSKARKLRRKSVRNPPSGSVLGKRTLIDESSDSDSDVIPVPKAHKLMYASIVATHSSQGVEDATFVPSLLITPPTSKHPSPVISTNVPHSSDAGTSKPSDSERITLLESQVFALQTQRQLVLQAQAKQIADMQLLVSKLVERFDAQGELRIHDTCHAKSIQRKDNDDNDPSDYEEEDENLECLDDIDELFDDVEEDVLDNEVEEGEIVEIKIEKSKDKVTYERSDGLNVPYNFIQDDVIPKFSYDGVTYSMDFVEDITTPDDTAQSKIDSDVDTTHDVSPKLNEEPVMYRNTGMTRE